MTGQGLTGQEITNYANSLWAAFPDLSFEVVSDNVNGDGMIAMQWLMRGTNTGSFLGLPPTGRSIQTKGADFIRVVGDKIRSVQGYFDTRSVPEQLGLQVVVQPDIIGPFSFGVSTRVQSGKKTKPGAFSITVIHSRSDEEKEQIRNLGRQIVSDLIKKPGFISWVEQPLDTDTSPSPLGTTQTVFKRRCKLTHIKKQRGNSSDRSSALPATSAYGYRSVLTRYGSDA